MATQKNSSSNSSAQTVFDILRELCATDRPLGVAEIHRIINEPTSSTHRALMTLEEAGLAERFGRQISFGPGPMVQNLVRAMIAGFPIRERGVPLLSEITKLTEAPATLNARLGWYSIRVGWAEGRHELFDQRRIGQARLLHENVAPITMLSTFSDKDIASYQRFVKEHHPEVSAVATSSEIIDRIALGREQGYLVKADYYSRASASWVSFPVFDAEKLPCGAISVALDNDEIPNGGKGSARLEKLKDLINRFQQHLDEKPEQTQNPYDFLSLDEIQLKLGSESVETIPAPI